MLDTLGLSASEERAYVALLELGGGSIARLAEASGLRRGELDRSVGALEAKGLVSRSLGTPTKLIPATPEVAIEMLLLRRQEELERARLTATQFVQRFRRPAARNPAELVEVVLGADAIRERFIQLQRSAQEEVLGFDQPPYVLPTGAPNPVEVEQLARGVRYRIVYDTSALEVPGQVAVIEQLLDHGEEARTVDDVPMKLAIADRKLALVPLSLDEPRSEEALLVYSSALLDSLVMLFESLWARAVAIRFDDDVLGSTEEVSGEDRKLLSLLAAGLKDAAIASQLGVSHRTVGRRITRLTELAGVRTRFQLGLQAGLRGWLRP